MRRRRPPFAWFWSGSLATLLLLVGCSTPEVGLTRLDEPMPPLAGPLVQGGQLDPAALRGAPLVINFWASWCAPCRREQPMLQSLAEEYEPRGVRFLGVNSRDSNTDAAQEFIEEYAVTYPSVADESGKVAFDFKISAGLPGTIVVDADGTILYRKQGEITREELVPLIDEALGSPAPPTP